MTGSEGGLLGVLAEAQRRGFIGPGPLEPHVTRSRAFVTAVGEDPHGRTVDLGPGGGLPGLVLAQEWTNGSFRLVEASLRRAAFLRSAVRRLDLGDRVLIDERRAEEAGRDPTCRGRSDLVVARAFGRPAVTAECAAPFLLPGGLLVVAEPPTTEATRWPAEGLRQLALAIDDFQVPGFVRLRQVAACPEQFPRRVGIPAKRPLF